MLRHFIFFCSSMETNHFFKKSQPDPMLAVSAEWNQVQCTRLISVTMHGSIWITETLVHILTSCILAISP